MKKNKKNYKKLKNEALGGPTWRPITEAPRDGTVVDLWNKVFGRITDASFRHGRWVRWDTDVFDSPGWCPVDFENTHFMPRPEAPEEAK